MAIDQCADDSAAIRVVEQADGTMRWELVPYDQSIEIVDGGTSAVSGARLRPGPGLYRHGDGRLAWKAEQAARVRTAAGTWTNLSQANGTVVLQEAGQAITNTTAVARDLLVGFTCAWVDLVETGNPGAVITTYYAIQPGAITAWETISVMHTDMATTPRRTRHFGGSIIDLVSVPAGGTVVAGMKVDSIALYATGTYSSLFNGVRIDAFWLGGPTA